MEQRLFICFKLILKLSIMKKYIQLILTAALILSGLLSLATTYTWTGGTSTAWNTTSNWSPAGVPGSGDYVHIYSATFNPTLPGKKTLSGMTMHSGTLNCNGDTLVLNSGLAYLVEALSAMEGLSLQARK